MINKTFYSADEVLLDGLKDISSYGKIISPRGFCTKEIEGYSFTLMNPRARLINIAARKWSLPYAIGELCWHLRKSNNLDEIAYYSKAWRNFSDDNHTISSSCYGKVIFDESNNQWESIYELLKHDPNTRRAEIRFGYDDNLFGADVSCITSIHFMLRNKKLNCITHMRSNDIIWGLCYDLFFITFLQEVLAIQLDVELGVYRHIVDSFHFYEKHESLAKKIMTENLPERISIMEPLTDLTCMANFLNIEEAIRTGKSVTSRDLSLLTPYWRDLSQPLLEKRQKIDASKKAVFL